MHTAGKIFGEIGTALTQPQRPIYEGPRRRRSPVTADTSSYSSARYLDRDTSPYSSASRCLDRRDEFRESRESRESALFTRSARGCPEYDEARVNSDKRKFHGDTSSFYPPERRYPDQKQLKGSTHPHRSANGADQYSHHDEDASPYRTSDINKSAPYIENMGGFHTNKLVLIRGVPHPNASRFSIFLQQGGSLDPQRVAMVFDVRFCWGSPVSKNCVVRNHKDGTWNDKEEERNTPYFPFKQGKEFEMIIMADEHAFKVAVDDKHFIEFGHRVQPLSDIDTLRIGGDVTVNKVRFQE